MDAIVLSAFDGVIDWLPLSGRAADLLPFPLTSNSIWGSRSSAGSFLASGGEGMPCLRAVLLTSWFCFTLTVILLVLCRMYPTSEIELILDATSLAANLDAILCHRASLRKVSVKAFDEYDEAALLPIFQELAELPDLKTVATDLRVSFHVLSLLVDGAKNLQDLSLHFQLRDNNTDGDIHTLVNAIQNHPSLKSITIESSFYDAKLDTNLDPLIHTLADLSGLQTLSLYNLQCSSAGFSKIFQSCNLQSLELSNVTVLTSRQVGMLQDNKNLKALIAPLHCATKAAWGKFVTGNTSLEKLALVLEESQTETLKDDQRENSFIPIAQALGNNKTLLSLTLDVNENLSPSSPSEKEVNLSLLCMEVIAASIGTNSSLKTLRLGHCSESIRDSPCALLNLAHAVRQNYTLEEFELRTGSCGGRRLEVPEIDFYLRCNRIGRGDILRSQSSSACFELTNFVIQHRADISLVFHMLLEKPEAMQNVCAI